MSGTQSVVVSLVFLFDLELVEGKDEPPGHGQNEKGKTVGHLLCLTKNIWITGKLVTLMVTIPACLPFTNHLHKLS